MDANLYMINPDLAKKPTAKRRGRKPKSTVPVDSGNNTSTRSIGLLPLSSNGSLPHNLNASFRLPDEVLNFASSRKEPVRNMNELDRNSKKRRDNEDDHAFCRPEQMSEAEDLVDEAANDVQTKGAEAETCEIRKRTESRNSNEDLRKQLKKFRRAAHLPTPISSPGNIEKINICAFCHFEYGEKDDPLLDEPSYECIKCRLYCHALCMKHHQEECRAEPRSGEKVKNRRKIISNNIVHVHAKKIGAPDFPTPTQSLSHRDLDATEDFDEDDDFTFDEEVFENVSTHSERLHSTPNRTRLAPKGFQASALADTTTQKRGKSRKQIVDSGTDSEEEVTAHVKAFPPPATAATSCMIPATPVSPSSNTSASRLKRKAVESSVSPDSISPSILISEETVGRFQSSVMSESVPTKRKRVYSPQSSHYLELVENADEQCCLLALVDSFKNLGDQGRLVAKQEILRILGNVVYEMSIPSMLISNVGLMARSQEGTEPNKREGRIYKLLNCRMY